ncbi:hypothetical protein J6590_060058 [Homalodisca vitripennis]|nr:hypothetical protein J6590_060058 [Homalodisca vitripennis]
MRGRVLYFSGIFSYYSLIQYLLFKLRRTSPSISLSSRPSDSQQNKHNHDQVQVHDFSECWMTVTEARLRICRQDDSCVKAHFDSMRKSVVSRHSLSSGHLPSHTPPPTPHKYVITFNI